MYGPGSPLAHLLDQLPRIACGEVNVLVTGESGVGKELVVRRLHALSHRGAGPFIPINCGAIPEGLLESELFGHVKGAFTGADKAKMGRLMAANGGTLFLDEIGEMPMPLQVKLLRVLQEFEVTPIGATSARPLDIRVVAATNRDLDAEVRAGSFRQDLFFRLDVARIEIPPLRERAADVAALARHFLMVHRDRIGSPVTGFSRSALDMLCAHDWPGNVRELENAIQGMLVVCGGARIEAEDVARRLRRPLGDATRPTRRAPGLDLPEEGLSLRDTVTRIERQLIRQALARAGGNKSQAAKLLSLNRTTLIEKLRRSPLKTPFP